MISSAAGSTASGAGTYKSSFGRCIRIDSPTGIGAVFSSPKSNNILHIIAAKLGPVRASPRGGHPSIMILLDLDLPMLYT